MGVKALAEDLHTGEKRHTNSCFFTMVAKNPDGDTIAVPPLERETELDERLYRAGEMRREMRAEMRRRNEELHVELPPDYLK
ncbi:MAG: hypothetical protein HKO62_02315 [Gammaproteobacteria bacterium]|nr:hypothetical protein [Gammaproteobacteria bacterium]